MSERDYAPLSIACVRGLCDKLYEKRKFAGVEIEKMVKDFNEANNTSQIKRLLRVLGQDLMASTNPNVKNGALMGLSSVAVGLGKGCVPYLEQLVLPAAACCGEGESRVRYQAAEALYNVAKTARGAALPHFPLLFDALAALAADPEPQVRHAAELLDRLVKDIVTESEEFDVRLWVPLVRERLYARAAGARQFAVSWLAVLDAAPAAALAQHLPELLDGLFRMLDDPNPEIRRMCEVQLSEFLRSVRAAPERADAPAMLNVLITHAQAPEDLVQLTALRWVSVLVGLPRGERRALPFASGALAAALPALAYTDEPRKAIREAATTLNSQLLKLVTDMPTAHDGGDSEGGKAEGDSEATEGGNAEGAEGGASGLQLEAVVAVLSQLLHHSSVHTKVAALDWFLHLYNKMPNEMRGCSETVFVGAVSALALPAADDVARRALAVLAEICSAHAENGSLESSPYYRRFLSALLRLLAADDALMEDRGAFIIRQVCVLVGAEAALAALAELVAAEPDLRFAAAAAALLGQILLTAAELYDLRQHLRQYSPDGSAPRLVSRLYPCWSHSPVALLALCLLTGNYRHCNRLINTFGDLEITVDFLTEVDKLVQLIESPIFAFLRLELLRPDAGGRRLRGCLRGLLMLLPQTDAFHTLRRRLQCVPPPKHDGEDSDSEEEPEWAERLRQFRAVQRAHRRDRMLDRGPKPRAPHTHPPQP